MEHVRSERRKYPRYDTALKLYYNVKYDIKMRVIFWIVPDFLRNIVIRRYPGVIKNISAEGLCFVSKKKLEIGDILQLEVYAPKSKIPIKMESEVRWCQKLPAGGNERNIFQTGVKIILVNGKSVADSIYFDNEYKVMWSEVLNIIFSNFAAMIKELKKK